MSVTSSTNPVDAIIDILNRIEQFDELVVESGETVTIPANEIWYVEGDVVVNGDLEINGKLINGVAWENKPDIYRLDEVSPKARENTNTDTLYVRNAGSVDLERFSADVAEQTEDGSAECLIYSFDESRSRQAARDVVGIFQDLMNDNYSKTDFHNIEPTAITDNRAAKITRQTDHYVFLVEIETHRLE